MKKKTKRWNIRRPSKAQIRREIDEKRVFTERHLGMTIADWRLKKRQQWSTVMRAMELFNYGSAYTPAGNDLYEMEKSANRIQLAMENDWVCW